MEFKVVSSNGAITTYSGEDVRYSVNEVSGVLTIYDVDDKRFIFSSSAWLMVEDTVGSPFIG